MINRRLIRIKVFQALFGEFGQDDSRPSVIIKNIKRSIEGIEDHFLGVLAFGPEFSHFISAEHDPSEFKFKPTENDIKSFELFTNNILINKLAEQRDMEEYRQRPTIVWQNEKDIMFMIFKQLKNTDEYHAAMSAELTDEVQVEFAKFIYKFLLLESIEFEQLMEDQVISWYDEKIPILKAIDKVFTDYEEKGAISLPRASKNAEEDFEMAEDLVENFFEHRSDINAAISEYTPGWDSDRITKIDYVLMMMALCEFRYMPAIPVKVTLNEYIEIAKMYSTPKSSKFINGTLDKILQEWKNQNLINKKGRGLIG